MLKRPEFLAQLKEKILLLDGGYGTRFFEMGHGGMPSEVLNIKHPESVLLLHREYVEAGADILLANTFGGNRLKLVESGLEGQIAELNAEGIRLARLAAQSASDKKVLVFGDLSSTGCLPAPSGNGSFFECRDAFKEQAIILAEAGCDGLIVETMTDIKELKAAVIGIREALPDIPLIAHMAFAEDGTSLTGASVEVFAAVMEDLEVDVLGMNCLVGPDKMLAPLRRLAARTSKPLSAEPNAGDPHFDGKKTSYEMDALAFSLFAEEFQELGVSIFGGCCGTTPEHMRSVAAVLKGAKPHPRNVPKRQTLASRTGFYDVGAFTVIGERINPTGRPQLKETQRNRDWSVTLDEAQAQVREGSDVLDVNFGVEKFFDADGIASAFIELDKACGTPLSLDIQTIEFLERALCEYPGRPLVNSSACDVESIQKKIPLLKKYGGMLVLLAMDKDIAMTVEERMSVVHNALQTINAEGIETDRVFVDPLALSIGARNDPKITLGVIEQCRKEGIKTVVGLSNLSHGIPNRSGVNAAFLSRAVDRGLSAAIMNSGDAVCMPVLWGAKLLETGELEQRMEGSRLSPLVEALLGGKGSLVKQMVQDKISEGVPALEVSQVFLGGAMEEIGDLYEAKKIFLPHILFAAETAFPIFDELNALIGTASASRGKIVIATVEGDIHDIGKNIVGTILRAGGFEVIDLGKNVPAAVILDEAEKCNADIIGLSAMMTTTVGRIAEVMELMQQRGLCIPIISGGASMNAELAQLFGVVYAENASESLALCKAKMDTGAGN